MILQKNNIYSTIAISIVVLIHFYLLTNLRFTAWPEMLSYPYLLSKGFSLYTDIIHPYPPLLTYLLNIWYGVFGFGLLQLKIFTWIFVLSIDLVIYKLLRKLVNEKFAIFGTLFYVLVQPFFEGNMMWFDLAVVPFLLLNLYFLIKIKISANFSIYYFYAGLALTLAILIKQTAGIFFVLNLVWIGRQFLHNNIQSKKKALLYFSPPIVIGISLMFWLLVSGAVRDFFNWTLLYPFTIWSAFPGYVQMGLNKISLINTSLLLVPIFTGLILLRKKIYKESNLLIVLSYFAFSLIMVYPRFSFFHFQFALSLIAISIGILATKNRLVVISSIACLIFLMLLNIRSIKTYEWQKESRFYGKYEESFGDRINLPTDNSVFFLGVHSGLYSILDFVPPKPWFDNFGWYLEIPGMQETILNRWDINPPDYVVWREPGYGNWFDLGVYQPMLITNWIIGNYNKVSELERGVWLWQRKS